MWTNPIISITVLMILYGIGKVIAQKTKGIVIEVLFVCVVYIVGYLTGVIPRENLGDTGIPAVMATWGTLLLVTNLGTMIELKRFLREWRTVLICLCGLLVITVLFYTVGSLIFNRYYALCALPPVAGGIVAAGLVIEACEATGMNDYAAFTSLVCSFQTFIAIPITSALVRKFCAGFVQNGSFLEDRLSDNAEKQSERRCLIRAFPSTWNNGPMMVARLLLVCLAGVYLSKATGGKLPVAVLVLVLGIVCTEIGFLERETLSRAGWIEFLFMGLLVTLPYGFRTLTAESFGQMLLPILFYLLLGAAGLLVGGAIMGKILKIDWRIAAATSLCAMLGYPLTEWIPRTVVSSFNLPPEEEKRLLETVMPSLVIAGFVTVTISSVIMAGFIAPTIFR